MACTLAARGLRGAAFQQQRQHLGGIEREIVGLHDDHAVDRMALDLAQELVGAALAIGLGPVAADEVAVVVRHQPGVGVDDDAAGRIVDARQLVERHEARPVVFRRPARHRHRAVALAPDRHARRRDQPDVPGGVGIDHVLHRRDDAGAPPSGIPPSSAPGRGGRSPRPRCRRRRAPSPAAPARGPGRRESVGRLAAEEVVDHRRRAASRARAGVTGSPHRTLIVSSRTANGRAPSGVM